MFCDFLLSHSCVYGEKGKEQHKKERKRTDYNLRKFNKELKEK